MQSESKRFGRFDMGKTKLRGAEICEVVHESWRIVSIQKDSGKMVQKITCKWIDKLRDYCDSKNMLPKKTVMTVPKDTIISSKVMKHALSRGIEIKFDPWPKDKYNIVKDYTLQATYCRDKDCEPNKKTKSALRVDYITGKKIS
jgi:hypothetical protein